jgi:TPR repeat protein
MCFLSNFYHGGLRGLQQGQERAMELLTRAAELGYGEAQYNLGVYYYDGGDLKKAKLHYLRL